ncbi:TPA: AAA family ATPase [Photobacterium damselae]
MNKLVVVCNAKGGSGKSTLCISLSAYAESVNQRVILVDGDPTGVSKWWCERRGSDNVTAIHLPSDKDISFELAKIKKKNQDALIIVDCGGFDNIAMRTAVAADVTDLVVITTKCSPIDLLVARPFIVEALNYLGERAGKVVGVMMESDALPSMTPKILEAKAALSGFGVTVLNNFTVKRDAYRNSFLKGGDALKDPKAKAEISAIYNEIMQKMGIEK